MGNHLADEAVKHGAIPSAFCIRHFKVGQKWSGKTGKLGHLTENGWCVSKQRYEVINGIVWGIEPQEESK